MCAKWKDIYSRLTGKGIYPHELAFLLDTPIRKLILSPKQLVKRLNLSPNFNVLEIGPGPGYFSTEIARSIPYGKLFLYDIQIEMLNKSKKKIISNKISNAFFIQGNAAYMPFTNSVFNLAFMVTVLGEISEPKKLIVSLNKVLRIGGYLSITEMKGDADELSEDEINLLVLDNGFVFLNKKNTNKGFTINYKKIRNID